MEREDAIRAERARMIRDAACRPGDYEIAARSARQSGMLNAASSVLSPWVLAFAAIAGLMLSL